MVKFTDFAIKVEWFQPDGEWVATTPEYPSLSFLANRPDKAVRGLVALLKDIIRDGAIATTEGMEGRA